MGIVDVTVEQNRAKIEATSEHQSGVTYHLVIGGAIITTPEINGAFI